MAAISWGRRELLLAMSAAAAGVFGAGAAAQQVKWSEGTEPPKLKAPPNACDCHHHIYDCKLPGRPQGDAAAGRRPVADYRVFQKRIGTTPPRRCAAVDLWRRQSLHARCGGGVRPPTARGVVVVNDRCRMPS